MEIQTEISIFPQPFFGQLRPGHIAFGFEEVEAIGVGRPLLGHLFLFEHLSGLGGGFASVQDGYQR